MGRIQELFSSLKLPKLSPHEELLLPVPAPDQPTAAAVAAVRVPREGTKASAGSSTQPGPVKMAPGKGATLSKAEKERLAVRRAWEWVNTDPAFKRHKPPTMWGKTKHFRNHCSKCGAAGHRYNDCPTWRRQ